MEIVKPKSFRDLSNFVATIQQDSNYGIVSLAYYSTEEIDELFKSNDEGTVDLLATYEEDEIVALSIFKNEMDKRYRIGHFVESTIVAHPNYNGKGIGVRLFQEHLRRSDHIEVVLAQVLDTNASAIRLLERSDFVFGGTDLKKLKFEDGYHDVHRYFLVLEDRLK